MPFAVKLGSLFLGEAGQFNKRSIKDEGVQAFDTEAAALAAGVATGLNEKHLAVYAIKSKPADRPTSG